MGPYGIVVGYDTERDTLSGIIVCDRLRTRAPRSVCDNGYGEDAHPNAASYARTDHRVPTGECLPRAAAATSAVPDRSAPSSGSTPAHPRTSGAPPSPRRAESRCPSPGRHAGACLPRRPPSRHPLIPPTPFFAGVVAEQQCSCSTNPFLVHRTVGNRLRTG